MNLQTIASVVDSRPPQPVFVFRPNIMECAINYFRTRFQGRILYAVKTNPERQVIHLLHHQGIHDFDVASYEEIRMIKSILPDAGLYFMHPVKSSFAIQEAYFNYGVRHFALDSLDELKKIVRYTNNAKDLCLHLRLAIPNTFAEFNLSAKFGIHLDEAPELLKKVRKAAYKLGITFHVGSQCMHPDAYRIAIRLANKLIGQSKIAIEYFDVGGGFPSIYPGMTPPPLEIYFNVIHEEFKEISKKFPTIELLCEPGRCLVAESTSVIVRVESRKKNQLYINDGTYGSLFDAGIPHFIFPVRLIKKSYRKNKDLIPYSFYGPTCDCLDYMQGPFYLPSDIKEGNYIEIGQVGAYGRTLSTGFNGFKHEEGVIAVSDKPIMSMFSALNLKKKQELATK
ncbi:ornithine decarboxylase [Rickettsiella grylli]|uniref:type III PLP-dependent enzyme n=1 Tax=Rickettsiella grylli TaxID=59196 RepID=UPI0008FD200C|nr:type III PLP-dependent enzyme [Rickettsiella grylli]OIZ99584.1 ornithine decarboxylase [Rickettsiella grylli]